MTLRDPTSLFRSVPVVPVVVIDDPDLAIPLAEHLVVAGLRIIEVTLRTERALDAVARVAKHVPGAVVGAGTVLSPTQLAEAVDAGAAFAVSPGTSPKLLDAFAHAPIPALPGIATVSEALIAAEAGFHALKFFPAETSGGVAALKAFAGPLPHLAFCPTGGIDVARAATYLGLPNVMCVGGSWITPPNLLAERAFDRIEALARAAAQLNVARPHTALS